MSKIDKSRSKFFKCACYTHALEVEHDIEFDQCNLTIWHYGHEGDVPLSFKERLRWAWKLIVTGSLWADEVVLSSDSRKELIEFLIDNKEKQKTKNEKVILHG